MSELSPAELRNSHLEELFNRARPRARYISESHVEEETTSIAKEIINGDIAVSRTKANLDAAARKDSYQEMLRRKLQQQIERERQQLSQKLGYIQTSLHSLQQQPQHLKRRSGSPAVPAQPQAWRKEFQQQMEKLQQRKREAGEKQRQREAQAEGVRAQVQEQEKARRKAELETAVKVIQQRSQARAEQVRSEQEKLKEILSKKELFQKLEERFQLKEEDLLEERKRKLAELRQLKQPLSLQELLDHEQRVTAAMRQKQALRSRELRMNSSRARAYKPSYESAFYRQAAAPPDPEPEEHPKHKLEKMRQFSQQVKNKYAPEVDEEKRREMEEKLERESRTRAEREERERELLEKPKLKGLEYLELVKKLPKKSPSPPSAPHSDRPQYKNYLGSVSVDLGRPKPWKTILGRSEHKAETALLLQYESQKVEERLRRKEEYTRVMKKPDDGAIDQDYYDMVKAKLDLLAKD